MRHTLSLFSLFILPFLGLGQQVFQKTYGGTGNDGLSDMAKTSGGNIVLVGGTGSFGAGGSDIYLIKINPKGDTLWTKTYGGGNNEGANSIAETDDGGFLIIGNTESFGTGPSDVYLIRTDSAGNVEWTKTYGGGDKEKGLSVKELPNGDIVFSGSTRSNAFGGWDFYCGRLDPNGNLIWDRKYGTVDLDQAYGDILYKKGHLYFLGEIANDPNPNSFQKVELGLIKTNGSGDTLLTKSIGKGDWDRLFAASWKGSDEIVVTGLINISGTNDLAFARFDTMGNVLSTRGYKGSNKEVGHDIINTGSSSTMLGETNSFGKGKNDFLAIKVNDSGDTLWTRTYGGGEEEVGAAVLRMDDGGYLFGGETKSFGTGGKDIYLVKTDSEGNSGECHETVPPIPVDNSSWEETRGVSVAGGLGANTSSVSTSIFQEDGQDLLPVVTLNIPFGPLCQNESAMSLSGGTPSGGSYSGTGVSSGMFDPTQEGPGDHVIQYSYTDGNGCSSYDLDTITVLPTSSSTISPVACDSFTVPSGDETYTTSGTYEDTLTNAVGCDSLITIDLTINTVDTGVTQNGNTLTANSDQGSYQWLDCDSGFAPIAGETGQSFTASTNGNYAVEVSKGACVDTSSCHSVTSIGIDEPLTRNGLKVYPNPTKGKFTLEVKRGYSEGKVVIRDVTGRVLKERALKGAQKVKLEIGENGVYLVKVEVDGETSIFRMITK